MIPGPFSQCFHNFVFSSLDAFWSEKKKKKVKYESNMNKFDHTSLKHPRRWPRKGITVMVIWAMGRIRQS